MGWGGSKNNAKKPGRKDIKSPKGRDPSIYKKREGFKIDADMIRMLTDPEKSEFWLTPDQTEYFTRQELPEDKYVILLKAIKGNKPKEYLPLIQNHKITAMDLVTGLDEQVEFGNKKEINGTDLNPLHWAVYSNNIDALKAIIKHQIFNIIIAGKVPTNTGMANESEASLDAVDLNDPNSAGKSSFKRKTTKIRSLMTYSERYFNSAPRSLLLFWAIDTQSYDIFKYLWELPNINWGLKNLKFQLTMICIKENQTFLETFLFSSTFSRIIDSLSFDEAMDFLEAFIVKNERIPDETKAELFERKDLLVYDFMGELTSLGNVNNDSYSNKLAGNVEHIRDIFERLTDNDIERIRSSRTAIRKIEELRKAVNDIEDSELYTEIIELLDDIEGDKAQSSGDDEKQESNESGSDDQSDE